jgi:hypothetical protein
MGEMRNTYIQHFIGKPEGKILLGMSRRRWEDNIKMDLRKIVWEGVDWMRLVQDMVQWRALLNTALNFPVL